MAEDFETPERQDQALNEAILGSDISSDFLPLIELCRRYYADEVDLVIEESPRRTIAKSTLEEKLMDFLLPIHLIAEMGGVQVNVEAHEISSRTPGQRAYSWSVVLLATNGARHAISWKTSRTWIAGRIVSEQLYDQRHEGPAIRFSDLELRHFGPDYLPDHLRPVKSDCRKTFPKHISMGKEE